MKASLRRANYMFHTDVVAKMEHLYHDAEHYCKNYSDEVEFRKCGFLLSGGRFDLGPDGPNFKDELLPDCLDFLARSRPGNSGDAEYALGDQYMSVDTDLMWAEVPAWGAVPVAHQSPVAPPAPPPLFPPGGDNADVAYASTAASDSAWSDQWISEDSRFDFFNAEDEEMEEPEQGMDEAEGILADDEAEDVNELVEPM